MAKAFHLLSHFAMALDVIDISAEGLTAYVGTGKPRRKAASQVPAKPSNRPPFNGM
jgi:hypothetical protein